jgi:MOSC domain-containing protein YiiM
VERDFGGRQASEFQEPPVRLVSVNVSLPREVAHQGKNVLTGIFKEPVAGRVMLRRLNLDGDRQADLRVHGGFDKAVYAYPAEHYTHWKQALGRSDLSPGQFGENLTVEGMTEDAIHIGDAFRVGGALVEVTQPRAPCFKLGIKMGSSRFPKAFLASGRVGFYLRVLEEGEVGAGEAIQPTHCDPASLSVAEVLRLMFVDREDVEGVRRALGVRALAAGWHGAFEERLAEAGR